MFVCVSQTGSPIAVQSAFVRHWTHEPELVLQTSPGGQAFCASHATQVPFVQTGVLPEQSALVVQLGSTQLWS
jgi:hypothetical protein